MRQSFKDDCRQPGRSKGMPKKEGNRIRSKLLCMTVAEGRQIHEKATAAGLKASEYIRRAALRQKIVVVNDANVLVVMAERNRHLAKIATDNARQGNTIN